MMVNWDLTLFSGGKMGVKSGEVSAYPLGKRNVDGMTF